MGDVGILRHLYGIWDSDIGAGRPIGCMKFNEVKEKIYACAA